MGDCFGIEIDSFKISGMVKNSSSSRERSILLILDGWVLDFSEEVDELIHKIIGFF